MNYGAHSLNLSFMFDSRAETDTDFWRLDGSPGCSPLASAVQSNRASQTRM